MTIKEIKEAAQSPTPEWFYKRLLIIYASLFGVFLTICGFMLNGYQNHIEDTFKDQAIINKVVIENKTEIDNIQKHYATKVWSLQTFQKLPK